MAEADESRLDPTVIATLYFEYEVELRRFLLGLTRDPQTAGDVLQATFTKAIEQGHTSGEETRKAWLFRVAYHQAMAVVRRKAVDQRAIQKLGWLTDGRRHVAEDLLVQRERAEAVRVAIEHLPPDQQQVVRMRIYQDKTFAQIADELSIPLGTALGRMRSALSKLRISLHDEA